ncbi:MAG: hypothetical protein K2R98_29780 [Gemmataceae bacterium]|nr:hypothetical protein [Gemmataceae bacterium]
MTGRAIFEGWYHKSEGRLVGPLAGEAILALVHDGALGENDELLKAWRDGEELHFFPSSVSVLLGTYEPPDDFQIIHRDPRAPSQRHRSATDSNDCNRAG